MPFEAGDLVAGYVVQALVGHGGTSSVFRVLDPRDGATRALKVLDLDAAASEPARSRFHREFRIAHSLVHPHVIAVVEHGEVPPSSAGRPPLLWTTMEYVDGGTGASLVPRSPAGPDLPRVLTVAAQLAGALDHAHARDVVHRDVKPANVLQRRPDADGTPWALLTDFGIARLLDDARPLARNGRVASSLPYAAPEVLQALRVGAGTDVYGLACTVVEWLTGLPPFPLASPFAIAHAHISRPPPSLHRRRPWIPEAADPVLARAMAKDPGARHDSCAGFVEALTAALEDVVVPEPARASGRLRRWRRG